MILASVVLPFSANPQASGHEYYFQDKVQQGGQKTLLK
jgi:hypothetical protein